MDFSALAKKWEGKFDQLTGKAKETWADLTDDVFLKAEGNVDQLIGNIKEKTGETEEEIARKLDS